MPKKSKRQVRRETSPSIMTAASEQPVTARSSGPNTDYSYVIKDLRRIGILAGSFILILIVLSFFLR